MTDSTPVPQAPLDPEKALQQLAEQELDGQIESLEAVHSALTRKLSQAQG